MAVRPPPGRLDRPGSQTAPPGRLDRPGWPHRLVESSASVLWLNRVTQWFSSEPLQTPQTRCRLHQSPLMTRLPRSSGSTLVLRLNQETVHDFVPLFLPPCGPHLTPLATGSLEPSLLVFSTPGGLTGDNLSRLFFTCTNTNQATTCTCNTKPRVSPHNVVNHSSHQEATIHRSSNHTWSSQDSGLIVRVHLRPGEQVSGTVIFVIPHREKANKVFGKRFSHDCSQTLSRLVFRQDTGRCVPASSSSG
jgi:hypothetical protein